MQNLNNKKPTKFIYMGDPQPSRLNGDGPDYSLWGKLLRMATEKAYGCGNPEDGLLLLGGDLVNRGNRREEWEAFFEEGGDLLDNMKVASPESFFSFDYGCCHFLVVNSEYMGTRRKEAYKFIGNWIRDDLQESDMPVRFMLMHHPMFDVGTSFNDKVTAQTMRDNYLRLLTKNKVDFILCGHQHLYCRRKAQDGLVQLMGVSGTKYFPGWELEEMDFAMENESVATVFEVTDDEIRLETIDSGGAVIDTFTGAVNEKPKKDCTKCPRYETCKGLKDSAGSGPLPLDELEKLMAPDRSEGTVLTVRGEKRRRFTGDELAGLIREEHEYSVMRRGRLAFEHFSGIRLADILDAAGAEAGPESTILFTNSRGMVRALKAGEILTAGRYSEDGELTEQLPAIITDEMQLIFGQRDAGQYNGSQWVKEIGEIEIIQ